MDDRPFEVRQIRQIDTAQFPSPRTARLMNVLVSPCCKKRNRDFGFSPMVASSSSSVGQSTLVSNLLVARSSQLWLSRHPQWGVHGRIEALVMIVRNGHAAGTANAAGALRHLAIAIRAVGGIEALVTIVHNGDDGSSGKGAAVQRLQEARRTAVDHSHCRSWRLRRMVCAILDEAGRARAK